MHQDEMTKTVQHILELAQQHGATAAEAGCHKNQGFITTVRKNEVEAVEYHNGKSLAITVYIDKRRGSVSTTDIRPESLAIAVKNAYDIATFSDEDEFSGLADKDRLAFDHEDIQLSFPSDITVPEAIELAKTCENAGFNYDKRITNSEGVEFSKNESCYTYGNTHDFIGVTSSTSHQMNCALIAEKQKEKQRACGYTIARDFKDLLDPVEVGHEAARKTVARLGSRRIKTCRAPVIFFNEEARGFWGCLMSAISGSALYRKSSFLCDHLNKKIFPDWVTISEKPHLPKGLGTAPFDAEGVLTYDKDFIKEGILRSYCLNSYAARKLGMATTGNAGSIHNLCVASGKNDFAGLLRKMDQGLLITETMGQGVNIITGDYSRGVTGFWVENGQIQFPVEEITIAGNLSDMFNNVIDIGSDIDIRSNVRTGSVLIDDLVIAGM